jgi:hypothetical protein
MAQYTVKLQNACYPNKPSINSEFSISTNGTIQDLCNEISKRTNFPPEIYNIDYQFSRINKDSEADLKTPLAKYFTTTVENTIIISRAVDISCIF